MPVTPIPASTADALAGEIQAFVAAQLSALVARYLPGWRLPGFLGGFRRIPGEDACTLLDVLSRLEALGTPEVAGLTPREAAARVLPQLTGARLEHFYSYFLGEALLAFGGSGPESLYAAMSPEIRDILRKGCDSGAIYDPATDTLRGFPNNFWPVLGRAELARLRLGFTSDTTLLERCVAHSAEVLAANSTGFFDDSTAGDGIFDSYSWDVVLFSEPLWDRLPPEVFARMIAAHQALADRLAHENGALVVWGRSTSALAPALRACWHADAAFHGWSADLPRCVGLVADSFAQLRDGWFTDDLVNAHRVRMTDGYRGLQRLLQMTFNVLAKLAFAAQRLRAIPGAAGVQAETSPGALYPPQDVLVPLDDRGAAVWCYRDARWSFQLPLVWTSNSDYVAWPRMIGVLETPVCTWTLGGAPLAGHGTHEWTTTRTRPSAHEHAPGRLTARWDAWRDLHSDARLSGSRELTVEVAGDALRITEQWRFDTPPDALTFLVPETAGAPLDLAVECDTAADYCVLETGDTGHWRSHFNALPRVHQWNFAPAREIRFVLTVRRAG